MPYVPYLGPDVPPPQPMQGIGQPMPVPPIPPGQQSVGRRRVPGLPVPPMPVMPPEGIAPVTDPISTGTAPDASPTTMVLQYLKSRGYQPTSENVRRALEANARDPGVIPGLRSDRPSTEAEDQAAMAAAGRGGGGGGRGLPVPPIPPSGGDPNTSAAPTTPSTPDATSSNLGNAILGMSTLGALGGAGLYGVDRFNRSRAGLVEPAIAPSGATTGGGPGEVDYTPSVASPTEPRAPDPMQAAIAKAIEPAAPLQITGPPAAPDLPGVRPVDPGFATMPPRGPVDMPPIPFKSQSPRVPPRSPFHTSTTLRGLGRVVR